MSQFNCCLLDPRAEKTREWMRRAPRPPKDLGEKSLRLALHLSESEAASLERLNPDTLGHDDSKLRDLYWRQFVESPASNPFKVNKV